MSAEVGITSRGNGGSTIRAIFATGLLLLVVPSCGDEAIAVRVEQAPEQTAKQPEVELIRAPTGYPVKYSLADHSNVELSVDDSGVSIYDDGKRLAFLAGVASTKPVFGPGEIIQLDGTSHMDPSVFNIPASLADEFERSAREKVDLRVETVGIGHGLDVTLHLSGTFATAGLAPSSTLNSSDAHLSFLICDDECDNVIIAGVVASPLTGAEVAVLQGSGPPTERQLSAYSADSCEHGSELSGIRLGDVVNMRANPFSYSVAELPKGTVSIGQKSGECLTRADIDWQKERLLK